jgi:hypothetical protein
MSIDVLSRLDAVNRGYVAIEHREGRRTTDTDG